jgi:hypothetical protein
MGNIEAGLQLLHARQHWFDDSFQVTYVLEHYAPMLECFYSLDAFRIRFQNLYILAKAYKKVLQEHQLYTSDRNVSLKLIKERPDLAAAAHQLANDPTFRSKFIDVARVRAENSMRFITPEKIRDAIATGIEILMIEASDSEFDEHLAKDGENRTAKEQQQNSVNAAHAFVSRQKRILKGRKKDSKTRPVIFSYSRLCMAVQAVNQNDELEKPRGYPRQADVARFMGYKGVDPSNQLGNALRQNSELLQKQGHNEYRWGVLCVEILAHK